MTKSGLYICLLLLLGTSFAISVTNIAPNSEVSIKVMAKNDSSVESKKLAGLSMRNPITLVRIGSNKHNRRTVCARVNTRGLRCPSPCTKGNRCRVNKDYHTAPDSFSLRVTKGRVCATRRDTKKTKGWWMNLVVRCFRHQVRPRPVKRHTVVRVGPNKKNRRTVCARVNTRMWRCPSPCTKGNGCRVNKDYATAKDAFRLSMDHKRGRVCATRTDGKQAGKGWWMNLQVRCFRRRLIHIRPVRPRPVRRFRVFRIGNKRGRGEKCAKINSRHWRCPRKCTKRNKCRVNRDYWSAPDTFKLEVSKGRVCATRTDKGQKGRGWAMNLHVRCSSRRLIHIRPVRRTPVRRPRRPTRRPVRRHRRNPGGRCFRDSARRDLPHRVHFKGRNRPLLCRRACGRRGFRFAGLQYTNECWCGNTFGRYGLRRSRDCHMKCPGNSKRMCGGGWAQNIYRSLGRRVRRHHRRHPRRHLTRCQRHNRAMRRMIRANLRFARRHNKLMKRRVNVIRRLKLPVATKRLRIRRVNAARRRFNKSMAARRRNMRRKMRKCRRHRRHRHRRLHVLRKRFTWTAHLKRLRARHSRVKAHLKKHSRRFRHKMLRVRHKHGKHWKNRLQRLRARMQRMRARNLRRLHRIKHQLHGKKSKWNWRKHLAHLRKHLKKLRKRVHKRVKKAHRRMRAIRKKHAKGWKHLLHRVAKHMRRVAKRGKKAIRRLKRRLSTRRHRRRGHKASRRHRRRGHKATRRQRRRGGNRVRRCRRNVTRKYRRSVEKAHVIFTRTRRNLQGRLSRNRKLHRKGWKARAKNLRRRLSKNRSKLHSRLRKYRKRMAKRMRRCHK